MKRPAKKAPARANAGPVRPARATAARRPAPARKRRTPQGRVLPALTLDGHAEINFYLRQCPLVVSRLIWDLDDLADGEPPERAALVKSVDEGLEHARELLTMTRDAWRRHRPR